MKCVVTGCAGFIGSHLSERLLKEGFDVTGVDCFTDYYPRKFKESNIRALSGKRRFRLVEKDILKLDLAKVLEGSAFVFHLAAQAGVRASWGKDFSIYTNFNVLATQALLEAAKDRAVSRSLCGFVCASSSSVYGNTVSLPMREDHPTRPVSPYGVTKLAAEHLAMLYHANYGVPSTALRFFTVYGPRQRPDMAFHIFLKAILKGEELKMYGDGGQTRDFTYVKRYVPGEVFNVGGGERISLDDAVSLMEKAARRKARVRKDPAQKGDVRHTYSDISKARRLIGYAPAHVLADGLAEEYKWIKSIYK
jgi:nucleoside-diphosphate-sugar epimerase